MYIYIYIFLVLLINFKKNTKTLYYDPTGQKDKTGT